MKARTKSLIVSALVIIVVLYKTFIPVKDWLRDYTQCYFPAAYGFPYDSEGGPMIDQSSSNFQFYVTMIIYLILIVVVFTFINKFVKAMLDK